MGEGQSRLRLGLCLLLCSPAFATLPGSDLLKVRGTEISLPFWLRIAIREVPASSGVLEISGLDMKDDRKRDVGDENLRCSVVKNKGLFVNPASALLDGGNSGRAPLLQTSYWVCKARRYERVLTEPLRLTPAAGFVKAGDELYRGALELVPKADSSALWLVNDLDVEEYLGGLVNKEIRSDYPAEAVKAQVIAARSYALATAADRRRSNAPFDLHGTEADQVYQGTHREDARSFRFVRETQGQVLFHQDEILKAYYHSSSGGHSELPQNVWGKIGAERDMLAYLARPDPWDAQLKKNKWTVTISPQMGLAWKGIGLIRNIRVLSRSSGKRVRLVEITGTDGRQVWSGTDLRQKLGPRWLKSTLFTVEFDRGAWKLHGSGWGHGVGLSQLGAREMARGGKKATAILEYYYPYANIRYLPLSSQEKSSIVIGRDSAPAKPRALPPEGLRANAR
jgi:stage II sporulation protein D